MRLLTAAVASICRLGPVVAAGVACLVLSGPASINAQPSAARGLGPPPTSEPQSVCASEYVRPHVVDVGQKITGHAAGPAKCYASTNAWSWSFSQFTPDRGGIFTPVSGCKDSEDRCVLRAMRTQTQWDTICVGGVAASGPSGGSGWESCDYYAVLRGRACVVPNVVETALSEAKRLLRQAQCRLGRVSGKRSSMPYSLTVVDHQSPPAWSIRRHDFRVNVKVYQEG